MGVYTPTPLPKFTAHEQTETDQNVPLPQTGAFITGSRDTGGQSKVTTPIKFQSFP